MRSRAIPDDFYDRVKPRLYKCIGQELRLAYRILDIGCGSCELGRFLEKRYHQQITGVDISSGRFPERRHSSRKTGYLRCIRGNASNLNFLGNGSIDAVVSMWALHEMKGPRSVLREARRKLRPGGKILIVDFPRRSLAQRLWNENYYTSFEIREMLINAGFQEVKTGTTERRQIIWAEGRRGASNRI